MSETLLEAPSQAEEDEERKKIQALRLDFLSGVALSASAKPLDKEAFVNAAAKLREQQPFTPAESQVYDNTKERTPTGEQVTKRAMSPAERLDIIKGIPSPNSTFGTLPEYYQAVAGLEPLLPVEKAQYKFYKLLMETSLQAKADYQTHVAE